jgi:HTH-type transcriptional repressor of puuD
MVKILNIDECPAEPMDQGRGETIKLVNTSLGTEKLDLHLNRLIPGAPRGMYHRHSTCDNVYIVRRGEGTLVANGKTYLLRANQVVYIPAGMPHSLSNLSDEPFEIFEIYAPAGQHYDFKLAD